MNAESSEHPFTLHGKTILVVGASSGIGAATSRMVNSLGAKVLMASRTRTALEAVRGQFDGGLLLG